jgi:hypothetical protein
VVYNHRFEDRGSPLEINIQRESAQCLKCGATFQHKEKHHSLLRIENKDFLREDYCLGCWSDDFEKDSDGVYSSWETRYHDLSVVRATPHEQFMPMLNLCYESIAEGGAEGESMAYMCALILRRQKVFRFVREEKEEEGERRSVLVFLDKHNDTQMRIVDPELTDGQMHEVKQRLEKKISPEEQAVTEEGSEAEGAEEGREANDE